MDKKLIFDYLQKNNLTDIEEIKYKDDILVLRFYYDFDQDEFKSAKAYSQDECEEAEEGEVWYEEYFLPYLNEIAVDNVGEIIESLTEENDFQSQFISFDLDIEEYSYNEFIAIFYEKGNEIEIEDVLDELKV